MKIGLYDKENVGLSLEVSYFALVQMSVDKATMD